MIGSNSKYSVRTLLCDTQSTYMVPASMITSCIGRMVPSEVVILSEVASPPSVSFSSMVV